MYTSFFKLVELLKTFFYLFFVDIFGCMMSLNSAYYETLEINRTASDAEIKKAYRRLAVKFHPRRNGQPGSAEKFCQLSEAYDVLSDPLKKAIYDKFGEDGLKGGIPPEFGSDGAWSSKYTYHGNPDKTFQQFFGGDNPFADFFTNDAPLQFGVLRPQSEKTQDPPIERELYLTLEDLFLGCTKKIKISRRVLNNDGYTSCVKDKILTVDVKPGWSEGTRVVFPKEGDQGPDRTPADVVLIVQQKSHPLFIRQHNDLIHKVKISLMNALTGFSLEIPTLDGRLLSIPINDIVHPAYSKVVTGEGMPLSKDPSQRGDLIITFDIQFPEKLSSDSKGLIKHALSSGYEA